MSAMRRRLASPTPSSTTRCPSMKISPSSGSCAPPRIFISVLLPAPFSPMSASTSPGCSDSETPDSAVTPGKRLVIPRICNNEAGADESAGLGVVLDTDILAEDARTRALALFLHFRQLGAERGHVFLA